jgi:hypothetical protein
MRFKISYQNPESEELFTELGFITALDPEDALRRAINEFKHITLHPVVEPEEI